ncbi:hypothetical protein Salat_0147000 [Sesamum alatum]|uniref:Uncharacterized protein n=1 Tax=Sesamum alatum TaxID=300844 RepID=A0AAE1YXJ0_9LAMI|nr:hypothetical protein Salat_0147000 [Sesamum alatum]
MKRGKGSQPFLVLLFSCTNKQKSQIRNPRKKNAAKSAGERMTVEKPQVSCSSEEKRGEKEANLSSFCSSPPPTNRNHKSEIHAKKTQSKSAGERMTVEIAA